jgi:hypothetical protein
MKGIEFEERKIGDGWTKEELLEAVSIAPGPQGMGLVPSMFTADPKGEYRLNTNSISIYAVTDASVKNKYVEATTGIKLPEKKLVLG